MCALTWNLESGTEVFMPKSNVCVSLDVSVSERLRAEARKLDRSMSWVLEQALKAHLGGPKLAAWAKEDSLGKAERTLLYSFDTFKAPMVECGAMAKAAGMAVRMAYRTCHLLQTKGHLFKYSSGETDTPFFSVWARKSAPDLVTGMIAAWKARGGSPKPLVDMVGKIVALGIDEKSAATIEQALNYATGRGPLWP